MQYVCRLQNSTMSQKWFFNKSKKKVQGKTKNLINNIRDDKNKNHSIRKNKIKYIYLFLDLQYKM